MQPEKYYVGKDIRKNGGDYKDTIKLDCIKLETTRIEANLYEYYKGYSSNGELLFEFRKGTVNVGYY